MEKRCISNGLFWLLIFCLSFTFHNADAESGDAHTALARSYLNNADSYNKRSDAKNAFINYDKAIYHYQKAIKLNSDSGDAIAMLANAYFKKGDLAINLFKAEPDKAVEAFSQAIELRPDYYEAYAGRQKAYKYLGLKKKAIADCSELIKLGNKKKFYPYYNRGLLLLKTGKAREAITDFNMALALNPDSFNAFCLRGAAYDHLGNYEKAIIDYDKAIALKPAPLPTYLAKGIAYGKLGLSDKAIKEFTRLIKIYPEYSKAFYERAKIYKKTGNNDKAIADFTRLVTLTPENRFVYYRRAKAYRDTGRYNKAIADYSKALGLKPDFYSVYYMRALVYRFSEQYGKAMADYNKKIETDPENPYLYLFRYIASEHGNRNEGNVLQTFADNFTSAQWISAVVDLYLGKITPRACLKQANHTNPQTDREQKCEAYYYIGEYYLFMNNKTRAEEFFNKCLNTGINQFLEYDMARFELDKLNK